MSDSFDLDTVLCQPRLPLPLVRKMLFDGHPEFRRMVWVVSVGKLVDNDILRDPRREQDCFLVKEYPSSSTERSPAIA